MPTLTPITLSTARLTLRPMTPDDAEAHYAIFSDPLVMRYWSSPAWTDIAQARDSIAQAIDNLHTGAALRLGVVLTETNALIGYVNLYAFQDTNRRCDIGYALASAHWGRGYLPEALRALIGYGFDHLNLNRIEADIDPRNEASGKVLEKLGFKREGYMKERWIVNGEICDTIFYGLLKSNWNSHIERY
jgi:[ribosomal protein S5]-alanine N-acetyltransferase